MEGHKALVSTLVVDGELLYSGSWDGVIRVWWRNDISPMAVLGTADPMMGGVRTLCLSNGMLFAGRDDGSIQVCLISMCVYSSMSIARCEGSFQDDMIVLVPFCSFVSEVFFLTTLNLDSCPIILIGYI